MKNIWLIGDTHFGHERILSFVKDGKPIRPFENVEHMNESLIENWNSVVRDNDRVYHLGDVTMHPKNIQLCSRLKGKKILIKGNHDIGPIEEYLKYFEDIRGAHVLHDVGIVLTHIPVHPFEFRDSARWQGNIHGHLHSNIIDDIRYFNVSVEQINFTPINIDEVIAKMGLK